VACRATDPSGEVRRPHEIRVRFALFVARHAAIARLLSAQAWESDNLGRISARIDVRLARSMACLASLPLRAFVLACFCLPVGTATVTRRLRLMARLTCVSANVERRVGGLLQRL
jgi:hypothetical protein